jgi:acetolactate synthase-1/2/3 large subunit
MLNTGAALLHAYSTNAQVLALIGQIPDRDIGRGFGHLHEIRDQAGVLQRLVDFHRHIRTPAEAASAVADAFRAMRSGRPGPAAIECAIDRWGCSAPVAAIAAPEAFVPPPVDEDAVLAAAKLLGSAKRPLIICGGGAQDSAAEIGQLSALLQAPVLGYRRGRGVLSSRDPLSVTLPLGHALWGEADVVIGVGSRMHFALTMWGIDADLKVVRIDANPEEPTRFRNPAVSLIGDAQPILKRLVDVLPSHLDKRSPRAEEFRQRQAGWDARFAKLAPQKAFLDVMRQELPENGIFVDEVTQLGFAARLMFPVYKPRTFISPGFQDNLGWGFATALGVQNAIPDVPVLAISGDGGFLYTATELATAMHHRIPLVTVVFADGSFGNVRRIQEEAYGNRLIACDITNPDFVRFAESFGAAAERARTPEDLRRALRRGFARRDGPTVIEVPVGPMPSPWEFLILPRNRGNEADSPFRVR